MTGKERKKGGLLTALGILAIVAAIGLAGYNLLDSERAGRAAQSVVERLEQAVGEDGGGEGVYVPRAGASSDAIGLSDPEATPVPDMPVAIIDGRAYIGMLEIPALELSLPVMADWDYEALRIAPCRYAGSYFTDDLVILGHNYARHFSPIKWIEQDTEVFFLPVEGAALRYVVDAVEVLRPRQVDEMVLADDWDMTMFTCTTGGQARCAVRCRRAPQAE